VLVQEVKGEERPIYFVSRTLRSRGKISENRKTVSGGGSHSEEVKTVFPKPQHKSQNRPPHQECA
ncbi:hypothetical protein A2U01_0103144, partial [Trifolium medium]|nr:hypothetical protein [Trifolium medium]